MFDLNWILNHDDCFRYQLLDRMRTDCDYYLSYGNRHANYLWAKEEKVQIAYMKAIWHSFPDGQKPEWLTYRQILEYEKQMAVQGDSVEGT